MKFRAVPGARGFTLLEVLVALGLMALVVGPVLVWYTKGPLSQRSWKKHQAAGEVHGAILRGWMEGRTSSWEEDSRRMPRHRVRVTVERRDGETRYTGALATPSGRALSSMAFSTFLPVREE